MQQKYEKKFSKFALLSFCLSLSLCLPVSVSLSLSLSLSLSAYKPVYLNICTEIHCAEYEAASSDLCLFCLKTWLLKRDPTCTGVVVVCGISLSIISLYLSVCLYLPPFSLVCLLFSSSKLFVYFKFYHFILTGNFYIRLITCKGRKILESFKTFSKKCFFDFSTTF